MENLDIAKKIAQELEQAEKDAPMRRSGRPRSMTVMKLQWLAERMRKCQKIKQQIDANSYRVDSTKVAKAILNLD